jgi:cell division protein ZapA
VANIEIEIAARKFAVACRDGEEEHLRALAAVVDKRARDAASALGTLGESRLLLFTSQLREGNGAQPTPQPNEGIADAAEALAARIEDLASRLEAGARND